MVFRLLMAVLTWAEDTARREVTAHANKLADHRNEIAAMVTKEQEMLTHSDRLAKLSSALSSLVR